MNDELYSLENMITAFQKADDIYKPSRFWQNINALQMEQIQGKGYHNFKSTLNLKYFNFVPIFLNDKDINKKSFGNVGL